MSSPGPQAPRAIPLVGILVVFVAGLSACDDGRHQTKPLPVAQPAWQWTLACPGGRDPATPLEYGRCAIDRALAELGPTTPSGAPTLAPGITITTADDPAVLAGAPDVAGLLDPRPESYVIAAVGDGTLIVGRDPTGAMYGALELAERLRLRGEIAAVLPPAVAIRGAPAVSMRAANLFWTVKAPDEAAWWFLDETFWHQYLDLMAYARMDWLDLHAMYDPSTTLFPNALLYLAQSASFPDVGVPAAERDANLAMFNKVVALAHARGIHVALMSYQASSIVAGQGADPLDDASLSIYEREAAADVATRVPGLEMIGFRIGESHRDAGWYIDSLVAGARQARPDLVFYTRTWGSGKNDILKLASAFGPGSVLESKYNGEQLGPPYVIAGGNFVGYGSYSYQDYLTPPAPWSFVFQVRTAGTHRIFRAASYERARRGVLSLGELSPAVRGFSLEPPHAYAQQRDVYHASASDRLSPWTFPRDDLMYLLWGRLGYDPTTPESTFRSIAARELGTDALWDVLQSASDIVPWIQTGHTCGPDHRSFNPEMELGGDVAQWAAVKPVDGNCGTPGPFDTFAVASPSEAAADLLAGKPTSRVSPLDVAARVLDDVSTIDAGLRTAGALPDNVLARDVTRESRALADLGRYFAHKLRGATALAVYARTAAPDWLAAARSETQTADDAWRALADDTKYIKPFEEHLRMSALGYDPFHWSKVVPALDGDAAALDQVATTVAAAAPPPAPPALPAPQVWLGTPRAPGPGLAALTVSPATATATTWTVEARFVGPVADDATVTIWWKPFDSEKDWTSVPASANPDGTYTTSLAGGAAGALFAVELTSSRGAWRYPDPMIATPYVSVAP